MKKIAVFGFALLLGAALASAADVPTLVGPAGGGQSQIPAPEFAVLWDQPLSGASTAAYVNQQFGDYPDFSSYLADDFVVPAGGWAINAMFIPNDGWNGATSMTCASMLHFEIYADAGGIPAGYPGGPAPVWSLAVSPTDPQITLSTSTSGIMANVLLTMTTPAQITTAGTYWFIFYPTADFAVCGQFGRQPADTVNGGVVQFINPGGGFGYGTGYQSWAVLGPIEHDEAFRFEGDAIPVTLQSFDIE